MIPEQCPCELGLEGMTKQGIVFPAALCIFSLVTQTWGCDWKKALFPFPFCLPLLCRGSPALGACTDPAGVFEPICPGHMGTHQGTVCPALLSPSCL